MILGIGIVWLLLGMLSFIYWWTKECDFTVRKLGLCLFVSWMGPIAFLVGIMIHGNSSGVIIRRRDKK